MIKKLIHLKNLGKFVNPSFGKEHWNGTFEKVNVIYANNGSGKTTFSMLFRSLKGNSEIIIKKKSFAAKDSPEITLIGDDNKEIKFSKGKWNKKSSNIEVYDSFFTEDNVYIITIRENLSTPTIFEILLGEESVSVKKQIDQLKEEIRKLKNKRNNLRYKRKAAGSEELRIEVQERITENVGQSQKIFKEIEKLDLKLIELSSGHRDIYLEKINNYLRLFNPNLKLTKLSPKKFKVIYTLEIAGHSIKTSETTRYSLRYSLSEGDKNALSLSFYLAKLELLPNLKDTVVVIDDPVTSFDYSRRNTTINNLASLTKKVKMFILLTHDLAFANEFSRKLDYGCNNLKIDFNGTTSYFIKHDIERESMTGIFKDLNVLHEFLNEGAENDTERREIARCIRPVLEGVFRVKYFKEINRTEWLGDIIGRIRAADSSSVFYRCKDLLDEISEINDYSKDYHHSNPYNFETPINDEELRIYVKRTIDLLYKL